VKQSQFLMSMQWLLSIPRRAGTIVPIAVACATVFASDSSDQTAGRQVWRTLRAVTVATSKDGVAVVIEANGPLVQPSSGSAINPPRIYIDFADVLPGQPVEPVPENPLVRRVRVAEHSPRPLITRVVIDLTKPAEYRIDSSSLAQGRLAVTLSATGSATPPRAQGAQTPQAAALPKPPVPATQRDPGSGIRDPAKPGDGLPQTRGVAPAATPATTTAPSGQAAAERSYGVRVSAALVRLHALRPLLESIDHANPLPNNVDAAVSEFASIGKILSGIKPPRSRERAHELLQRTCTMGVRAIRMRQDGDRTNDAPAVANAASAAAGALLMLDRANQELAGEGK